MHAFISGHALELPRFTCDDLRKKKKFTLAKVFCNAKKGLEKSYYVITMT